MKIKNRLRDLLLRQPETLMLSREKAIYDGETYTFNPVTAEEIEFMRMDLLKIIDNKSWAKTLFEKIFKKYEKK